MIQCWALIDYRPGTANQVLGIARHTGFAVAEKRLQYNKIAAMPNYFKFGNKLRGIDAASRKAIRAPWPDIVISAGRRTAPVAAHIKLYHPDVKLVHLMKPEWSRQIFDMVVMPRHDAPKEDHSVITTLGAPHALTDDLLFAARARMPLNPDLLPRPWTLLCLGGNTSHGAFLIADIHEIVQQLEPFVRQGSLLLTGSRRTTSALERAALDHIKQSYPHIGVQSYFSDQGTENPYHAWLAQADQVITTGDSVSMISEASFMAKPVYVYMPEKAASAKHQHFCEDMVNEGYLRDMRAYDPLWQSSARLDEAARIGRKLKEFMA